MDARPRCDLPKVELHLHLDCALSFGGLRAIDRKATYADYRLMVGRRRCSNLAELLEHSGLIVRHLQDERALRVLVEDVFAQLVEDGVIYAELRFAPLQHLARTLSPRQVVEIVENATRDAITATGIEARLILCTLRHYSEEASLQTAQLAVDFRGSLVVGLDLAGDESRFPLAPHIAAFRLASSRGVRLTAHAGEAAGPESVRETLDRLQPERLGHGVRSIESVALQERLIHDRIHLEVCPSSNLQTGVCSSYATHPIDVLRRSGVPLSVSTDTRTITDVSLTREYDRVRTAFEWTDADFEASNQEALQAAFVEDSVRIRLLDQLRRGRELELDDEAERVTFHGHLDHDEQHDHGEEREALRPGSFLETVSGRRVDPFDPDPEKIDIVDIAQALGNQCRFGGHCRVFYSVAQHSVLVCDLLLQAGATPQEALAGLLHDATEAYLVDLPHPIKHRSALGSLYRTTEQRLELAVRERFALEDRPPEMKTLDRSLLATERRAFAGEHWDWPELDGYEPLAISITPLEPAAATAQFLARFHELDQARNGEAQPTN